MKKLFSLNLYLDALKRIRLISIVFLAITVFGSVQSAMVYLSSYIYSLPSQGYNADMESLSLINVSGGAAIYATMLTPIIMIMAMSYLFKRNESDFYESLPYSRGQMLVSSALAVMSVNVLTLLISSGVGVAMILPCLGKTVEYRFLTGLFELLGLLLCSFVSVAIASVAVSVTGTAVNCAIVSFVLIFAPRYILVLLNSSVEALCPTLISGHAIPLFDNGYNMLTALMTGNNTVLISPASYIYTALLGAAYAALAYGLFLKRKSEHATQPFANKLFRHIASVLPALVVVSFGIFLVALDVGLIVVTIFFLPVALGAYFAYSLITARKGEWLSTLKVLPIFIGASVLAAVTVVFSANLFNAYSPTAEEIHSVSIIAPETDIWHSHIDYSDYVSKRAKNVVITDTESKEIIERAIERGVDLDSHTSYTPVNFKINTGYDSYRTLYLTNEEYTAIITELAKNEEYKSLWLTVNEGATNISISDIVSIQGADAEQILATLADEVAECGFEKWFSVYTDADAIAMLRYYVELEGRSYIVSLPITEEMPRSCSLYLEKYRENVGQLFLDMQAAINSCVSGTGEELFATFNFTTEDKTNYWIDYDLTVGDEEMQTVFNEIITLLSVDPVGGYDDTVYLNLHTDSSFSRRYYGNFKVPKENMERLTEIFEEYGETYRDIDE